MKITRKGFTLVELLIVVAILGTLAASIMVVSKDASPKAKARQIATDLKTIAIAAQLYLSDTADTVSSHTDFYESWDKYVFGTKKGNFTITQGTDNTQWIATYDKELTGEVLIQVNNIANDIGITVTASKATMRVK